MTQVVVNNRALSKHTPLVMVPVFSSTFVLSNAVGAVVVFSEGVRAMAPWQWGLYGAGVVNVVGGVLLIARAAAAAQSSAKKKADVTSSSSSSSPSSPPATGSARL